MIRRVFEPCPSIDPPGWIFVQRYLAIQVESEKISEREASFELRKALATGEAKAALMDEHSGLMVSVSAPKWNLQSCERWLLEYKAPATAADGQVWRMPEYGPPAWWVFIADSRATEPNARLVVIAADERRALIEAIKILKANPQTKKPALLKHLRSEGITLSGNGFINRIWPKAREGANLPSQGKAGAPKKLPTP